MKKITLLFAFALATVFSKAQNFSAVYDFANVTDSSGIIDPSPVPVATGLTFGSFSATGTPPNPAAATLARFNFSGWATGSVTGDSLYSQMTGSVADTEYYETTLTPLLGYTITLDTVRFRFGRSSTGVRTYAVRSSADGFVANLSASVFPLNPNLSVQAGNIFFLNNDITSPGQNGSMILLSGASFTNLSSPISFRFYGWNSEGASGTYSIDNVRFSGSASVAIEIKEEANAGVSLFPNPSSSGLFTVDFGNASNKAKVSVYNIIGKNILTKELIAGVKQSIDLSNQANGVYFVNIKTENSTITRKIIVNK